MVYQEYRIKAHGRILCIKTSCIRRLKLSLLSASKVSKILVLFVGAEIVPTMVQQSVAILLALAALGQAAKVSQTPGVCQGAEIQSCHDP